MTGQDRRQFGVRPAGAHAVLLDLPNQESVHDLAQWLLHAPERDLIEDVVPGARTVLVVARRGVNALMAMLSTYSPPAQVASDASRVAHIPVVYDGPDLDDVCSTLNIDRAQFAAAHSGAVHMVAFFGFTPGFAYITGLPRALHVPRRANPRTRIPAGSVAIANGYTVIYPGDTPGGWNLVGHTVAEPLWDTSREPPNRLSLGDRILFRGPE